MRNILLIALVLIISATARANTYTTNFPATENPISEGGKWIGGLTTGLDWNNIQTTPGLAFGTATNTAPTTDPTAVLNPSTTGSWGSNQEAVGVAFAGSPIGGSTFPEVELRLNTTITAHSITGYEFDCAALNEPNPGFAIVRWNGPVGNFTVLAIINSPPVKNGEVIKATNVGGVLSLYRNNTLIVRVTDTTYTGGTPGIGTNYINNLNQYGWSSFTADDTPSAPTPLYSGVLSSARGTDWGQAGIPGFAGSLPDTYWSQSGSTISAYTGDASTINNALSTACDGSGKYVLLGAGTFNLGSTLISFPRNFLGHCALRGAGANSTFINYSTGVNCNGASAAICISSSDGTFPGGPTTAVNWTGGYAKGTTQITLSSVSGIVVNQTLLSLNQCDTGYSTSNCMTGSATDNGGYFVCSTPWTSPGQGCNVPGFSPDGPQSWRFNAWQMETVMVTAINPNGCGATCITISQPLVHPNWSSSLSPQAVLIQPVPQDGVENLSLDGSGAGTTDACINGQNTWEVFISGVKCANAYSRGFYFLGSFHMLIKDNYIAHANTNGTGGYGDGMGVRISWGGDDLIQNNICQQWKVCFVNDGPSPGDVVAYNFWIDQDHRTSEDDFMWGGDFIHATGDDFQLFESNAVNQSQDDNVHGGHLNQTRFRNFYWGWESCANGQCGSFTSKTTSTTAIISSFASRYGANIGNVMGTLGYHTIYLNSQPFGSQQIYQLGGGNNGTTPVEPPDPLVISTGMRWANYDIVTGATRFCGNSGDTGWGTTCGSTSEVPTGAPTYPNTVPTLGDIGAGQGALPTSFYLSSRPSWFGAIPWPTIGPDVTGGNIGQCAGTLNVSGRYNGLAATSSTQCAGSGINTAWAGHVNAIPAQACAISMGIPPDGTGSVKAYDPIPCYASTGSPGFSASPSSFNFGSITVGMSSSTQTFTITNTGSSNLVISLPITNVGGNTADFPYDSNSCASSFGGIIPAGMNCTIVMHFSPSAIGSRSTSVTFSDNAGGHTIPLSGTGFSGTASTPTFSPVAGTYSSTQFVSISTVSVGAIICYNTTGSPATNGTTGCAAGSSLYSGAITVSSNETIFAVAGGTGFTDSSVGSAAYVITGNPVPVASAPTLFI